MLTANSAQRRRIRVALVLACGIGGVALGAACRKLKPLAEVPLLRTEDVLAARGVVWTARTDGLAALDLTDPLRPVSVTRLTMRGASLALDASEQLLAVANGNRGLALVDVSEAAEPRLVVAWDGTGSVGQAVLDRDHAYLAVGIDGLSVADLSDPAHPMIVARVGTSGRVRRLALAGTRLATAEVAAGVRLFDVHDPGVPRDIGACPLAGAVDVAWVGGKLLAALGSGGLAVIDPAVRPLAAELHPELGQAMALAVAGSLVVISAGAEGIRLADFGDPATPRLLGHLELPAGLPAGRASIDGARLYVAAGIAGLAVVDIQDPTAPRALAPSGKRMQVSIP